MIHQKPKYTDHCNHKKFLTTLYTTNQYNETVYYDLYEFIGSGDEPNYCARYGDYPDEYTALGNCLHIETIAECADSRDILWQTVLDFLTKGN